MRICIVVSNFYPKISKMLIDGATKKLRKNKIYNYKIIEAPGTFEIPVHISSNINKYDGFIVLGCVIKGQTPHFDFLSTSVFNGLINLTINFKIPISNGILTCINKKQAIVRADPNKKDKGGEAAKALISIIKKINK